MPPAYGVVGASAGERTSGKQEGCLHGMAQRCAGSLERSYACKLKHIPAVDGFREQSLILLKVPYQLVLIVEK